MDDAVVEDIGGTLGEGSARQDGEVAVLARRLNVVVQHVLTGEVHHHRTGGIAHHVDTLFIVLLPVGITLRHVGKAAHVLNGIDDTHVSSVLDGLTLHRLGGAVTDVGQQTQQQGVVKHGVVEKQLLLRLCQLFIRADTPFVTAEEPLEGFIIGGEHRLRTRAVEHLVVAEVVNQSQVRIERSRKPLLIRILQF